MINATQFNNVAMHIDEIARDINDVATDLDTA